MGLTTLYLKDFDRSKNAETRAQYLAQHGVKPRRTINESREVLEYHLYNGGSKCMENRLKGKAP